MEASGPTALSRLTHHRWALPVLAHVHRSRGCKFVSLSRQLGVSPPALKRALDRLAELDLVVRNPGYGHPMRPEYVLGPRGEAAGERAEALVDWMRADALEADLLKKWQLPTLLAVGGEERRFGEIRTALSGASPRALSLALKSHAGLALIERDVGADYPPIPIYRATTRARPGYEAAGALADWLGR